MTPIRLAMLLALTAYPVAAQDTAGAWAPTFTARHGAWDVTCDARGDGDTREERCYARYIDVYSPQPDFGVVFMFVEIIDAVPVVTLGREFETDLVATTLRITPGWERPAGLCTGGPCEMTGEDAVAAVDALVAGGTMEVGFVDAKGGDQLRQWPAVGFAEAYADITREAAARGL
ncbi:MAG: hypothetical protein AAF762_12530 [Pseudomonadota bacterium]